MTSISVVIASTCFAVLIFNITSNFFTPSVINAYVNAVSLEKSQSVDGQKDKDEEVVTGSVILRLSCICHLVNNSFDCSPENRCTRNFPTPTSLESENIRVDKITKPSPNFQTKFPKSVYPAKYNDSKILIKKGVTSIPRDNLYVVGETSVASNGTHVLYVGNRYSARSFDNGTTWEYMDPKSMNFKTFCCDQRVIYDQHYKLFIWILQEHPIPRDVYRNIERIGVSKDLTDWAIYDIKPRFLNWTILGKHAFDFPDLAISDNSLYITSNIKNFNTASDNEKLGSVILRFSLDNVSKITSVKELLDARNTHGDPNLFPLVNATFYLDKNANTITPVQGASDHMFFATHINTTIMRIYQWNEIEEKIIVHDRVIPGWNDLSAGNCQKEREFSKQEQQAMWWCGNVDSRISAGWLYDDTIGFLWTANRTVTYGKGQLTMPYINSAIFDISKNLNYAGNRPLANPSYPWLYGSAAVNDRGDLGLIAFYGNNTNTTINVAFGVNTHKLGSDWKMMSLVNSTEKLPVDDPECVQRNGIDDCREYKWGDFITIRPHHGPDKSYWDISAYVLNGTKTTDVNPFYFVVRK
ncbi:MAG TPA: hypothetical protein VJS91_00060 [Nitrososphaeraceae archaeon]|nr:hypothetical protein [Nitrososphaeraceae archaeon]